MKPKLLTLLLLTSALLTLFSLPLLHAQQPEAEQDFAYGKIDPRLFKAAAQGKTVSVIIEMKTQANLQPPGRMSSALSRRAAMINALQTTANASQAGVRAALAEANAAQVRPLWIINAVAAQTTLTAVLQLAARDDVAQIRPDEIITLPPFTITEVAAPVSNTVQWGVKKIEADAVWQSLGIDGQGVVVANIDTGVDFLHPDLQKRYRGYQGGALPPLHSGNWFDATGQGASYPVDTNGHGTHTMGTIAGENGIGVAPGARWIAVRAFNSSGQALESWLHSAFQWTLAPEGNPALAPNVVNNSWGNSNGASTEFEADVQRLVDAGIVPVFSAGNSGSDSGSVGSPGSYAFAVGATDADDVIASFSSRGPSPWGKIKPDVSAPGVNVLSGLPGGGYGVYNGTSMAAPHVSGLSALLLQADASLVYTQITRLLTQTAAPLGAPIPNNTYGWGRADAYNAVQTALNAGQLVGIVSSNSTGQPIAGAEILITPRHTGYTSTATTNANGFYRRGVVNNDYNLSASAFGYQTQNRQSVVITAGSVVTEDFALLPLPTGVITGIVTEAGSGIPLSATIAVGQTPVTATASSLNGQYALTLPGGVYTLTAASPGHRIAHALVSVAVNQNTRQDFVLPTAPTILLVDGGAWYNASQISYYQQALDDLDYYYDNHRIKLLPQDTPVSATLKAYNVVVWSSPLDSPGYVNADSAIKDFLDGGGSLFLSGQDTAYFDDGSWFAKDYFRKYLKTRFVADNAKTDKIAPVAGEIYDGLSLTISGGNGANNQKAPDVIALTDSDFAAQTLVYSSGGSAGQRTGHCLPYRAVVLPFGLEGVNQPADRSRLLNTSLTWFQSARQSSGFSVTPSEQTQTGDFGKTVTHTFRLYNQAETGVPRAFTLSAGSRNWTTDFPYTTTVLSPCQSVRFTFTVTVPPNVDWNAQDALTVSVQSGAESVVITRTTKAPASLLLVDDDRWYDYEDKFLQALADNGITPDYWSVQGATPMGSPPLSVLQRYPMVVWFTGYDWFQPLTPDEELILQQYLDDGGRLFFSSQEYLYALPKHQASVFARDYFGVLSHTEYITSSMARGVSGNPIGNDLGPYPLTFPRSYQNWTDSLTPTATANPAMTGQSGLPNALTHSGTTARTWHTAFFAFGPELLNNTDMAEVMRRVTGWLSWLGASTVEAQTDAATSGDTITYTAVLRNDGPQDISRAVFTATFPPPLSLVPGSLSAGSEVSGQALWSGSLAQNQPLTLTYRAQLSNSLPYGTVSRQISWISLPEHNVTFDRAALVPVNIANWSQSTLSVSPTRVALNNKLTYTLRLRNTGLVDAPLITVTGEIPPHLLPLSISPPAAGGGGTGTFGGGSLLWQTPVSRNQVVTLTFTAQVIAVPFPFTFPLTLQGNDGYHQPEWLAKAWVKPYGVYLPVIMK